jgi:branched-chain amino acid transport system ATP-binding protein
MAQTEKMLQFSNVELYYDHVYALKGVSIELNEGETVALIGANGAGKSSILRAITGMNKIHSGEIRFLGQRLDGVFSTDEIVKGGIAMVPEGRRVFPYMSIKDNLLMGAFTRTDKGEIQETLDKVVTRFPRLKERYSQAAGTLSGGEQQMMVIGRALMARSIVEINREENVSVLLVEQNSRMALRISHRAYALSTGEIALQGKSSELLEDDRVKALYLGGEL